MSIDYQIRLIRFPNNKVCETVVENEDGSYTIFIEATLTFEKQKKALEHAMKHIVGGDFTKDNVNWIELDAHNIEIAKEIFVYTNEYEKK